MKEILKFLKPYRRGLILSTLAALVSTLCNLWLPTIMSQILNRGVYQKDLSYIVSCCGLMLAVAAFSLGAVILGSKLSTKVVEGFSADLRGSIFRKVNKMSFEEFGKLGTAALVTRATHDVETVSWIAGDLCSTVITIPMMFFGGVILAMGKDVMLALTMLAFVPVIMAIVLLVGKKILPLWLRSDEYIDKQNDIMRQRLRGIRVIRAFHSEDKEHTRACDAIRAMSDIFIRSNTSMGAVAPVATFLLNLAAVLIVYLAGWRMETGSGLTGGDVFAIVEYVAMVANGIIMGAFIIIMIPQATVAAGRIGQVLQAQGMADPIARQDQTFTGDITFRNVSFRYEGAAESALRDISLHIAPGEKVAIIGGTGAGKSTLVSMLLGFRMPTEGQVLLDGIPTERLSRYTMRQNMSCVLQNATIYSGTVRENVKMGKLDATDSEIQTALDIAQAREFVSSFPDGLDHEIKQSGKNLSGGQKQRLSIARAVLKNAPIYIFDDCFSALDFLTEARLRSALAREVAGKTQIIITQRVSTAMHCNRIYVMDRGAVVSSGTHGELLQTSQVYREIYESQTGGAPNEKDQID